MESDYKKLGLKCGLEIHQQLNTKKLFCNCNSVLRNDSPDFTVMRKLHAVPGETGEVDIAVEYQTSLKKEFLYQGYDTTCLVELDESPPFNVRPEALSIALQIALLLNAKILPITQVMRKTVVDGSNTGGFQRTLLVAYDGFVETSQGCVGIDSICLEEDSARIISQNENEVVYRLDRLGIPLIEIATAPDIKTPLQAKEVALYIGGILRACNVKRGIGTIRQDVNVSIKGGKRIEIKGVQNPDLIEKSVALEAERQFNLVNSGKKFESEVRAVLPDGKTKFLRPMPGEARMYPETDLPLLAISRNMINDVKKNLPKMKHETEDDLKKKGLSQEMIKLVLKGHLEDFEDLIKFYNKNPDIVAKMLTVWRTELATKSGKNLEDIKEIITKEIIKKLLLELNRGSLSENHIRHVFSELVKNVPFDEAIKFEKGETENIEEKILKIIKEKPGLSVNAYMGLVMKEFNGKISGNEAVEIIKKYFK